MYSFPSLEPIRCSMSGSNHILISSVNFLPPQNLTIFLVLVNWLYFSISKNAEEGG